jgi:threonine/homoserine/homoserine lactone efflux protein
MSKYETMRTDPANWKLGVIYCCVEDPRIIVRQLLPVGWTWNFGHPKVYLAILAAVFTFLAPPAIAWWLGMRSLPALGLLSLIALGVIMFVASRMSRDPGI